MTKQQTLTIVVNDEMADPIDLVRMALERLLRIGPIYPEYGQEPEVEFRERDYDGYLIIEEE